MDSNRWGILVCLISAAAAGPLYAQRAPATAPAPASELDLHARLLTGNNEPDARLVGARELLRMGKPEAIQRLRAVLTGPNDSAAQIAVCVAIEQAGGGPAELRDPLLSMLTRESAGVRSAAAGALAYMGDAELFTRLSEIVRDVGSTAPVRQAALDVLIELADDARASAALMGLLDHPRAAVAAAGLEAIGHVAGRTFASAADAKHWWTESGYADERAWLRRRNAQLRASLRQSRAASAAVVARLLTALRTEYSATPDAEREAKLLLLLGDGLAEARALGVSLVDALITDRKPVPAGVTARLADLLDDASPTVRGEAAAVLGDLRDRGHVPRLAARLATEPDPAVRRALVASLGRIGGDEAIKSVLAVLDGRSEEETVDAALALGSLAQGEDGLGASRPLVIRSIKECYARLPATAAARREAFLTAMGRIGAADFREACRAALADTEPAAVRRAAILATAATDDGTAKEVIRPYLEHAEASLRTAAAEALGRCGDGPVDLEALLGRLEPGRESDDRCRVRVWESLLQLLRRQPPAEQLTWAERFWRPGDAAALQQFITIVTEAEKLLPQTGGNGLRRQALLRLGDANAALARYPVAASYFDQVLAQEAAAGIVEFGPTAFDRALDAWLLARDYAAAQSLLQKHRRMVNGGVEMISVDRVARRLGRAAADAPADADDASLEGLESLLQGWLAADAALSPEVKADLTERLDGLSQQRRDRRTRRLISAVLEQGPAAGEAEEALRRAGREALPAIIEALATAAGQPPAGERALIEVARHVEPRWNGLPVAADDNARLAALDALRLLLEGPAAGTTPTTASAPAE